MRLLPGWAKFILDCVKSTNCFRTRGWRSGPRLGVRRRHASVPRFRGPEQDLSLTRCALHRGRAYHGALSGCNRPAHPVRHRHALPSEPSIRTRISSRRRSTSASRPGRSGGSGALEGLNHTRLAPTHGARAASYCGPCSVEATPFRGLSHKAAHQSERSSGRHSTSLAFCARILM